MNYLKAEHLKFKRTISNKLLWIIPLCTAFFAWFVGGFTGFQYMTFYWWYAFLLPGTIAILCSLAHQKEETAGKYYSVVSMPLSLAKFELAKSIILVEKLLVSALFLALFASISNVISPALAVYSLGLSLTGSIGIVITSVWQIPICLYLARKTGIFLPVALNSILCIFSPIVIGNSSFWWLLPYCWPAKFAEPVLGIAINGTYTGNLAGTGAVPVTLALSLLLFIVFTAWDIKSFSRGEGK